MDLTINHICKKLGITKAELGNPKLGDLNDVTSEMVSNLRKLETKFMQIIYLRQFLPREDYMEIPVFLGDILDRGESPEKWNVGAMIQPSFSFQQMLELPVEDMMAFVGMDFKLRTAPIRNSWSLNINVGAPIKEDLTTTYKTWFPREVTTYGLGYPKVESVEHMDNRVVIRRWIAQVMSGIQEHYGLLSDLSNISYLEESLAYENWTVDAKKALEGLRRESENNSWTENSVPGMTGDDAWYL